MVANAHATGEPGMVFIDRINAADPVRQTLGDDGKTPIPGTEDIEATIPAANNPSALETLGLGSINGARFVKADGSGFDLESLGQAVDLAVRFLDDVIEANHYPFDFVHEATHNNRRIGLGIMGFADALIMQGIAYDSERGTKCGAELMAFIQESSSTVSSLAKQRGVFPIGGEHLVSTRHRDAQRHCHYHCSYRHYFYHRWHQFWHRATLLCRLLCATRNGGTELIEVNPLLGASRKCRRFL